jgi:hypothetical protein
MTVAVWSWDASCVHCEGYCSKTSRITEITPRCQEHTRHMRHVQAETSTVAEYLLNTEHEIQFEKTNTLNRTTTLVSERSDRI